MPLIDLANEAAYLGKLIADDAPDEKIEAEFDRLCLVYFGYTRHELTGEVPKVVLSGFEEWYFEQVVDLGERHGFDFVDRSGDRRLQADFDVGYVIPQWNYFAEILIAKECGFFPKTSDEISKVKLDREAAKFQAELRRRRQQPRGDDLERDRIFGKTRTLKAGLIPLADLRRRDRRNEVTVEVIRTRRPGPPQGKTPPNQS